MRLRVSNRLIEGLRTELPQDAIIICFPREEDQGRLQKEALLIDSFRGHPGEEGTASVMPLQARYSCFGELRVKYRRES